MPSSFITAMIFCRVSSPRVTCTYHWGKSLAGKQSCLFAWAALWGPCLSAGSTPSSFCACTCVILWQLWPVHMLFPYSVHKIVLLNMAWCSLVLLKGLLNLFKCGPNDLNSPACYAPLINCMYEMLHPLTRWTSHQLAHCAVWSTDTTGQMELGCWVTPICQHIWILCTHLHHIKPSHRIYAILYNSFLLYLFIYLCNKMSFSVIKILEGCSCLHVCFPKFWFNLRHPN